MIERIEGFIDFIKYYDEKTGWTVFEMTNQETEKKVLATVVQEGELDYGMYVELSGKWIDNNKFGKQFKASSFFKKKPDSLKAFQKYLTKGNLYGIGPILAEKIIEQFGEKTLEIFDKNLEELLKIEGISIKKLQRIKEEWKKDEGLRDSKIFLKKLNIPDVMIKKIIDVFFEDSEEKIKENPYSLIGVVDKYSFSIADEIAMKIGIDKDFPDRIFHGIFSVLKSYLNNGDTWIEKDILVDKTLSLLFLKDKDILNFTINEMIDKEFLVLYKENRVSTSKTFYAEKGIATNLKRILDQEIEFPENIKDLIEGESLSTNISLSEEQREAVLSILKNPISVLTGGAGVGKTTTVQLVLRAIYSLNYNFLLAAPTGRAAQRMQEVTGFQVQTIHRLLSWSPEENGFSHNETNPLKTNFLILDESSMIDIFLMKSLLDAVGEGTQVLFIGDPQQLPSVGAGVVLSDFIKSGKIKVYKLTKIFRQDDDAIIVRSSYDIINGKLPEIPNLLENPEEITKKDCFFIDSDFFSKSDYEKAMKLRSNGLIKDKATVRSLDFKDLTTKEKNGIINLDFPETIHKNHSIFYKKNPLEMIKLLINEIIPKKLGKDLEIQILTPMKKGKLGNIGLNKEIQELLNPLKNEEDKIQGEMELRLGDRIIQTKNNYKLDFFNGDIGYLTNIFSKKSIQVQTNLKKINIDEIEFFGDLELSYSITIHKSQGSEFDVVIIPVTWEHVHMLYNNLLYTAITRGKKKVFFVGNREAFYYGIRNIKEVKRDSNLLDLLKEFI